MHQNAEIILSFRDGGQIAFNEFYQKNYSGLLGFLNRLAGNDAEDIYQEILGKFDRSPNKFASEDHATRSIYKSARNLGINHIKTQKNRAGKKKLFESLFPSEEMPDYGLENIYLAYLQKRVVDKIHQLPEKHRKVILMSFLEEKSHDEIARALSVTNNHVATLKDQAIKKLQKSCEGLKREYYHIKTMVFILLSLFVPVGHYTLFDLIKKIVAHFL